MKFRKSRKWPEGRHPTGIGKGAALSSFGLTGATGQDLRPAIRCSCGEWQWYDFTVHLGTGFTQRFCPRCRRQKAVVTRGPEVLAVVDLTGSDPGSVRSALSAAKLSPPLIDDLVRLAELMATG